MIIKRMKASFGSLHGAELEPAEGLNIIEAPNEAGKSTWCGFIRTMLYGINTSQRQRTGMMPDKKRFLPWAGYEMSGEMEIECRWGNVTLTRSGGAGKPMGACTARISGTAEKCLPLGGKAPGETLFGAPESVFIRSAFVSGASMSVDRDNELEKKISSLVSSGSDDSTYSDISAALRSQQRKRRLNSKVGSIPALEAELEEKKHALNEIETENSRLSAAFEEKSRLEAQQASLETEIKRNRKAEADKAALGRAEAAEKLETARDGLKAAEERARGLSREKICAARDALSEYRAAAKQTQLFEEEKNNTYDDAAPRGTAPAFIVAFAVAALLCIVLAAVTDHMILLIPAAAFAAVFAVLLVKKSRQRTRQSSKREERDAARARLDACLENENNALTALKAALESIDAEPRAKTAEESIAEKEKLLTLLAGAEGEYRTAEAVSRSLMAVKSNEAVPDVSGAPTISRAEAERRLGIVKERLQEASSKLAFLEGELRHLGDPLVLATECGELSAELEKQEREYEAITLAMTVLDEANAEMQSRFVPVVGKLAGKYMSEMTNGAYDAVLFDSDFNFAAHDGSTAREEGYLSGGTAAQMYLALRLAICVLSMPEDEPCPIVLDDALVSFDDTRAAAALRLLEMLAKDRQILLFTCQSREKRLLEKIKG